MNLQERFCMSKKSRKIVGVIIALAGVLELIVGVSRGTVSMILMGIGFCIIGSLYICEKPNM